MVTESSTRQVWGAVQTAGLEPFAGFLHTDRPGKPSLVLDLTEEFRAPLVDRTIVAALRRGELKPPPRQYIHAAWIADTRATLSTACCNAWRAGSTIRAAITRYAPSFKCRRGK